jgi:hypothetical protein
METDLFWYWPPGACFILGLLLRREGVFGKDRENGTIDLAGDPGPQ